MTGVIDAEIAFPAESDGEIATIDTLVEYIDEDIDYQSLLNDQLEKVNEWRNTKKKYNTRRYEKLEGIYLVYIMTSGNSKRERLIERKCDEHNIPKTRASHLSIRIVQLLMRPGKSTVYQYAAVLRYASIKQIPVDALAAELAKKGNGIDKMAGRFFGEFPIKRRPARSSGAVEQSGEAKTDDECSDIDGPDPDEEHEEEDDTTDNPDVDWGPNALKKWRNSKADGGVWLFIKWKSANLAKIMNKTKP